MIEKISEKVSVNLVYNHVAGTVSPQHIKWKNRIYTITKIGLHYTLYRGKTLMHLFSACDSQHYFLLAFNTQNLQWTLEEIADDLTN